MIQMIPQHLSAIWAAIARPMANHLWQSTAFLAAAWLLTLALRKNQARVRYWLWLTASIKFLIPFSLLTSLGSGLFRTSASVSVQSGLYSAVQEIGLPFTPSTIPAIAPASASHAGFVSLSPALLLSVWFCGFVVVLLLWFLRWRRISAAAREAMDFEEGREWKALRQMERLAGVRRPIALQASQGALEPGIFGIFRPVLLWPSGFSERLDEAHLKAILAHEVWHVRRRDNLTAAIHMIVEAVFWFHPLVWWVGTRLVAERERACDEEVLRLGNHAQTYAEGILKTCEFCVGSPLSCVSGVTGSDLKQRIVRIMSEHVADRLSLGKKLLLAAAGTAIIAVPFAFCVVKVSPLRTQLTPATSGPLPSFEVASVRQHDSGSALCKTVPFSCYVDLGRPGFVIALNATARELIGAAWDLTDFQTEHIFGGPKWVNTAGFDVQARAEGTSGLAQKRLMLQTLLADRFKLAVENTRQQGPMYALELVTDGKLGPRLLPHSGISTCIDLSAGRPRDPIRIGNALCGGFLNLSKGGAGYLAGNNVTLDGLSEQISRSPDVERTVVNRTGLTGKFDITLEYAFITGKLDHSDVVPADIPAPDFVQALKEQLGLKLVSTKGTIDVLRIDHIERPSPN